MIRGFAAYRSRKTVTAVLALFGALLLIVILMRLTGSSTSDVAAIFHRLPLWSWAAVAVGHGLMVVLAATRWRLVIAATAPSQPKLKYGPAISSTALGTLAGQVLPIQLVTPVIRAWVAKREAIATSVALGTSALEQTFDIIALLAASAVGALLLSFAGPIPISLISMIVATLALLGVLSLALRWICRFLAAATHRLAGLISSLAGTLGVLTRGFHAAASLGDMTLFLVTALSAVRYVTVAALNIGILHLAFPETSLSALILAAPIALLLGAVPIFPAGLGVIEMTWSGALVLAGVEPAEALAGALALRVVSTLGYLAIVPILLVPMVRQLLPVRDKGEPTSE